MNNKRRLVLLAVGLIALCVRAGTQVSASVLVTDTFNTVADPAGINDELGSPREGGTLMPVGGFSYTLKAQAGTPATQWTEAGGQLVVVNDQVHLVQSAWQDQNETSLVGTKYSIEGDILPQGPNSEWGFIWLAQTQDATPGYLPSTGIGVLIGHNSTSPGGDWGTFLGGISNQVNGTDLLADPLAENPSYHVRIDVDETGATTAANFYIDGNLMASGSGLTWGSGDRYLGVGALLRGGTIGTLSFAWDNLQITNSLVPEPSSIFLLVIGIAGLSPFRRRLRHRAQSQPVNGQQAR